MIGVHGPTDKGVFEGSLQDCPRSPNCVCTQASRPAQSMPALRFSGTSEEAIATVTDYVASLPRTEIVSRRSNYLHVIYRSRLIGFIDDVEFFADSRSHLLHFRSASRVGYSDLGANRRRMAAFCTAMLGRGFEPLES